MPTFAYAGRTRAGQTVSGERSADTMDAAVAALRREQILVTRITPAKEKAAAVPGKAKTGKLGKKVAAKNLAVFTRQFSVMIDAGLPLVLIGPAPSGSERCRSSSLSLMSSNCL